VIRQLEAGPVNRSQVHWVCLSPPLDNEPSVVNALAPAFGLVGEEHSSLRGLAGRVLGPPIASWKTPSPSAVETPAPVDAPASSPRSSKPLIVVTDTERLFRRTADGLSRFHRFLDLVYDTREHATWVLLMVEPAVLVLDAAADLSARCFARVYVPPLDAAELSLLLEMRHQLSGYGLRLETEVPRLAGWLRRRRTAWRLWRGHSHAAFDHRAQLSGGNARQAMRLWLALARLEPDDASTVVVGPLPTEACPLIDELPLSPRLVLSLLLLF